MVDPGRLATWLDEHGLEPGVPVTVEPLAGGASNIMFLVNRGEARWVLRRPAEVALARADEGMRREYRILSALEGTAVPHPKPLALCEDPTVAGRTCYLMEHVAGVPALPAPAALDDQAGRADLTWAIVDALAALHTVDISGPDLADLGRPDGFHERQAERWTSQLASYDGRELPGVNAVTDWLGAHRPHSYTPALMHGDYHMFNVMVAADRPGRVVAVVDWETATIGDPLLDLAGFCEIWTSFAADGWPDREAIIERYRRARGLEDLGDLSYYDVLYNFRMAVLLEGIYQRSLRDSTRGPQDAVGKQAMVFLDRARELCT